MMSVGLLFSPQPPVLSPQSSVPSPQSSVLSPFLLAFPALAILDNREAGQVETCAAAACAAGICIGKLQAAANQFVREVYGQAVQVPAALLIRYDTDRIALQDNTLACLHFPVNVGIIGQSGTTSLSNSYPQKLVLFQLVLQHFPGFFLNDNIHDSPLYKKIYSVVV